jgi:hypothetical protein
VLGVGDEGALGIRGVEKPTIKKPKKEGKQASTSRHFAISNGVKEVAVNILLSAVKGEFNLFPLLSFHLYDILSQLPYFVLSSIFFVTNQTFCLPTCFFGGHGTEEPDK